MPITINIELVFTVLAVATIAISSWAIMYFSAKIALNFYVKTQIGEMPTVEEISELYRKNNEAIGTKLDILGDNLISFMPGEEEENAS